MKDKYSGLKLENQLCFPLYVCAKEIIRMYKPVLDKFGLTYTQYITMMVMWEEKKLFVKDLGKKLYLDSGTLTPVLKKLEAKGYILRSRCNEDERNLCVMLTKMGEELREEALEIPEYMNSCLNINESDMRMFLKNLELIASKLSNTQ